MPQLQAPKVTKAFLPFEKILDIRTSLYQAVAQQKQHLVTNRHNLDLDLQRHHQAGDPTFPNTLLCQLFDSRANLLPRGVF